MTVNDERHGLYERLVERLGDALYTFVACLLALGVSGLAALAFEQPLAKTSSPRNALIGHLVAVLAGALCLALFGLLDEPSILPEGVTLARIGAGALSLTLTGAVLLLLGASHPPSGATVLVVSLGLLRTPTEMAMIVAGVVLLILVGWISNRAAGIPMPLWSARESGRGEVA